MVKKSRLLPTCRASHMPPTCTHTHTHIPKKKACTRARAHTHTRTHARTHMCTHGHSQDRKHNRHAHTRTCPCARARARAYTHTHTACARARTHLRTHARTNERTNARTHARTHDTSRRARTLTRGRTRPAHRQRRDGRGYKQTAGTPTAFWVRTLPAAALFTNRGADSDGRARRGAHPSRLGCAGAAQDDLSLNLSVSLVAQGQFIPGFPCARTTRPLLIHSSSPYSRAICP